MTVTENLIDPSMKVVEEPIKSMKNNKSLVYGIWIVEMI